MIEKRPSEERGYEDKGWLQTYHTFSFDTYYDQRYLGFRSLRVLNEDIVQPGKGFGSHFHKEMEIITYVLEGSLEHKDSMGNVSLIRPGEMQRMSAGTGITHSEYNLSHHQPVHFLQMWILPNLHALTPDYEQRQFSSASKWGKWCLMASSNRREGSLKIHQDADLYSCLLEDRDEISFEGFIEKYYWVQILSGRFLIQNIVLKKGDGASLSDETTIQVKCLEAGELLLFEL